MKLTPPFTGIMTGEGPAGIEANAELGGVLVGSHPGESSNEFILEVSKAYSRLDFV